MIHKGTEPYKGRVSLSFTRCSGGTGDPYWQLAIEDKDACQRLVEVKIPDKTFSEMMGHCTTEADAVVYLSENLGKKHEVKRVSVRYRKRDWDQRHEELAAIYDQAEIDNPGWKADREGWNGHRNKQDGYEVTLRRWVAKEGT